MGPAAGLKIRAFDFQQPHLSQTRWRLDGHGADEFGPVVEFLIGDPSGGHEAVGFGDLGESCAEIVLRHVRFRPVEIDTAPVGTDGRTGDFGIDDGAESVECSVHTHVPVAAIPVDPRGDRRAFSGQGRIGRTYVNDIVEPGALDRVDDADQRAVCEFEVSGIPRLSAANGIEDGPVEADASRCAPT